MFEPLITAQQPIPVHATLAMFAIIAGAVQFALPKGTLIHRCLGYFWMAAMVIVALTSFFITSLHWFGPFGPIHILSVLVLWSIFQSIRFARAGQIKRHMSSLIQLYVLGLIITGGFTLLPGRVMHQVVFGG